MLGYILATISSIFFSLYVIPRKLTKIDPLYFSLLMGLGFFVSSVILCFFQPLLGFQEIISAPLLWAVLAGAIWATSFVTFVKSIDLIGLARSNQWKNLQGPIGVLLSLIILSEYATTNPAFAILAGITIFLSALMLNIVTNKSEAKQNSRGIYLAALSGLGFGTVAVINKYVTVEVGVYSQQVVWSFSISISIIAYLAHRQMLGGFRQLKRRDVILGLAAGLIYLGASFFMLQSFRYIPAAVAFTIIQLSSVWTIAIGILVFKEIDIKRHFGRISLGFVLSVVAIFFLMLARK
jgi:glucose uptake protein GlcU